MQEADLRIRLLQLRRRAAPASCSRRSSLSTGGLDEDGFINLPRIESSPTLEPVPSDGLVALRPRPHQPRSGSGHRRAAVAHSVGRISSQEHPGVVLRTRSPAPLVRLTRQNDVLRTQGLSNEISPKNSENGFSRVSESVRSRSLHPPSGRAGLQHQAYSDRFDAIVVLGFGMVGRTTILDGPWPAIDNP